MKKDKRIPADIMNLKGDDTRFDRWHKASMSTGNGGSCVEVGTGRADYDGFIGVRDSKNPDGPALAFTPAEWKAFLAGAKSGEFDK